MSDEEIIKKLAYYLCECDEVKPEASLSGDGVNFLWQSYAVQARELLKIVRSMEQSK